MKYRNLGNTPLKVSTISLGTVSLGIPYGIRVSRDFGVPGPQEAIRLLKRAADSGINLFDTAPAYGSAEQFLGEAFPNRHDLYVATKVSVPQHKFAGERRNAIMSSLHQSLSRLRRGVLDIVQIHNAKSEDILRGEILEVLLRAKEQGLLRLLGASVYGEEAALTVIESNDLDVLQIAYSVLDQRPDESVLPLATRKGTGILVRSALLKGVLSKKAESLPPQLNTLKQAADRVRREIDCSWKVLPEIALRFCLSSHQVSSVLIGARKLEELEQGVAAWQAGPLPEDHLRGLSSLALDEDHLVNPCHWPIP